MVQAKSVGIGQQQHGVERAHHADGEQGRHDGQVGERGRLPRAAPDPRPRAERDGRADERRAASSAGNPRSEAIAIQSLLGHGFVGMMSSASNDGSPGDM